MTPPRCGHSPRLTSVPLPRLRTAAKPLVVACLALFLAATDVRAARETIFVAVKKTSIRKERQFYAPTVASAVFRDRLVVLARDRDWARVSFNGVEGWVHLSATAAAAVSVTAKEAAGGISDDDVAFASKGFDASVEKEYRKVKPGANFADVDRMEQLTASEKALADFRKAGNLPLRGEGR